MGKRNKQPRHKLAKDATKNNSTKSRSKRSSTSTSSSKPSSVCDEHLDGDMTIGIRTGSIFMILLPSLVKLVLCTFLAAPFWFLTYSLALVYGRPPKMVHPSQTMRYLGYTWFTSTSPSKESASSLSFATRLDLTFRILQHTITSPISGFCWLLDEIFYGRQMDSVDISKPLFVVSAYRSASTQMARVLHQQDHCFVAPCAAMCNFPYLWLWKLLAWLFHEADISKQEAARYLTKNFPRESFERHDHNPFEVDTFDGSFLSSHLNGLALQLSPEVTVQEFHSAEYAPHDRRLMEDDFVLSVDRIARKTMLFYNATQPQDCKTFLLKGHFLASATALSNNYPDARFLTILRDPLDRIQSAINDMATNPTLLGTKQPNWQWLTTAFSEIEARYCEREMEFYNGALVNGEENGRRLAVRFDSFVGKDFQNTLERVYQQLLPEREQVPHFVPIQEPGRRPNQKKKYTVNKSLQELGVEETKLKQRLANYYAWMKTR